MSHKSLCLKGAFKKRGYHRSMCDTSLYTTHSDLLFSKYTDFISTDCCNWITFFSSKK